MSPESPHRCLASACPQVTSTHPAPDATGIAQPGAYELTATFGCVMVLSALVLVVFLRRPGTMARLIISVPFSLFILTTAAIPIQAATGYLLLDFSLAEVPSPLHSTLRFAVELACYYAAWKCIPWLYEGKERLIEFAVRLLTRH